MKDVEFPRSGPCGSIVSVSIQCGYGRQDSACCTACSWLAGCLPSWEMTTAGETFWEAWGLTPALGAILLLELQQGDGSLRLQQRGCWQQQEQTGRSREWGKKSFLWNTEAVGKVDAPFKETVFHSKAFSTEARAAEVPKNPLWSLKHSKASYISAWRLSYCKNSFCIPCAEVPEKCLKPRWVSCFQAALAVLLVNQFECLCNKTLGSRLSLQHLLLLYLY